VASYNRIIMIGNLTKDPDYKSVGGQGLCRLSLASNRQYRNKQTGLLVQEVCYIEVEVWGAQAENCRQYLQKGRPLLVEGRLKLDTWKEADGQTRRRHGIVAEKVVFLGSSQQAESNQEEGTTIPATGAPTARAASMKSKADASDTPSDELSAEALFKDEAPFEDDLPF
jgi:single-strand DNA-binding protein